MDGRTTVDFLVIDATESPFSDAKYPATRRTGRKAGGIFAKSAEPAFLLGMADSRRELTGSKQEISDFPAKRRR
jgi:hypothetical protein